MIRELLTILIVGLILSSCQEKQSTVTHSEIKEDKTWNLKTLENRSKEHLDIKKWDTVLLKQDIETYEKYSEIFNSYPLNKTPFPIAEYDYAVSSIPFLIEKDGKILKGVRIGEYENSDSDDIIDKLTLIILTNDKEAEESTLVESRNFPYLTAQGYCKVSNNEFDWVFSATPDNFSTLIINMKLFDLRFGETVLIFPQIDKSFEYYQIEDSPNNYENFNDFKKSIIDNEKVMTKLNLKGNIKD